MNLKRLLLPLLTIISGYSAALAVIPVWTIPPQYGKLTSFAPGIFAFQEGPRWGLLDSSGRVVAPASYDYITPFANGYALAGSKENDNYTIKSIIDTRGNKVDLADKYYYVPGSSFVSEDKIAVSDRNGKYGFISPQGKVVVKCQFDDAFPFKEGLAPVLKGRYVQFITENYDSNPSRNILVVDFHLGEMTTAGCFSNGTAPVGYNKDFALIDGNGRTLRKISESEFQRLCDTNNAVPEDRKVSSTAEIYTVFSDNGKVGLKDKKMNVVAKPVFDSFGDQYSDGHVIASVGGREGLLGFIDDNISVSVLAGDASLSELEPDRSGNFPSITVKCELPRELEDYKIFMAENNGRLAEQTGKFVRKGDFLTATFSPDIAKKAENYSVAVAIEGGGIPLFSGSKNFKVTYPVRLRMSKPGPGLVRANSKDMVTVSGTIYNDSAREVTASGRWSTGGNFTVKVPANSSATVHTSFSVTENCTKTISLTVDGVGTTTSNIQCEKFF